MEGGGEWWGEGGRQVLKTPRKRAQKHIHIHTHTHACAHAEEEGGHLPVVQTGLSRPDSARGSRSPWRSGFSRHSRWKTHRRPSTGRRRAAAANTHRHSFTGGSVSPRPTRPAHNTPCPQYTLPENPAAGGASDRGRRRCARRSRCYMLLGGGALRSIRRFMPRGSDSPPSSLAEEPSQPGCAEDRPGVRGM